MQPVDKQSLLDSGILCCLIHILNALLDPSETSQMQKPADHEGLLPAVKDYDSGVGQVRRLEVSLSLSLSLSHTHTHMHISMDVRFKLHLLLTFNMS